MRSIIQQFTNDSWFRRGTLKVHSFITYLKDGEYVKEETGTKIYTRKFFIHESTEKEIANAGLGEHVTHTVTCHLEFALKYSDGKPVDYTLPSGETVKGVILSDEIEWNGYRYKLIHKGEWNLWHHFYYIAEKINQEQNTVC